MIFVRLEIKGVRVEVRFYEESVWDESQNGMGYCSTLPGTETKKQNPIGFIWEIEKEPSLIQER